jgi:hypothetical protein
LVIIGPGTGYQGQWLFWGPGGAVEPALRRRWPHMRIAPAPRGAVLPSRALREIGLTAEPLADDRHCGMNSLRHGKFNAHRSCALRNQINAKPRSHSSVRRRAGRGAPDDLRYELEIAGNGAAGHGQPGLIRNDAQSRLVRITAASRGNSRDDASRPMRCRSRQIRRR